MADANELTSITGHLYVRLRRDCGRVIDAIWAVKNADYAREVLRVAREQHDAETLRLADRYEELLFGKRSAAAAVPAYADEPDTGPVPGRYRNTLR